MAAAPGAGGCLKRYIKVGAGERALRCMAMVQSVVALMMLVRDRQLVFQSVGADSVSSRLQYSDNSGLVFLVYTNALVAIYSFVVVALSSSFNVSSAMRDSKAGAWVLFAFDQTLAYTLLSATSAATEVSYLIQNGDSKTLWDLKCNIFGHFCHMIEIAVILSFGAVIMLGITCVISARQLFQKYAKYISIKRKMHAINQVP